MQKILVLDGVSKEASQILEKDFKITEIAKCDAQQLKEIIKDYDALILRSASKITAELLEFAPKLKVIGRAGVGVDNIDINACSKKGIIVLNAPNGNTNAATEHAFALMLSLARQIPQAHESLKEARWDRKAFMGVELKDKILGVLGLGRIGAGVASRAKAFGMQILAYDPYLSDERAASLGVKKCELDEVLANSDFITLHLPLTDETRAMINEKSIAKMKTGARIINAARGECIDIDALAAALKSGKLAGAALDVFPHEPLGEHELTKLPNVVLTPHLGASTKEAQEGVAIDVARAIKDALNGQMVSSALNATAIDEAMLNKIKPYFNLFKALGFIAHHTTNAAIESICIEYGENFKKLETRALNQMFLCGLLSAACSDYINIVNAPVIAKERGIELLEQFSQNENEQICVKICANNQCYTIKGSLLGDGSACIDSIGEYELRFEPKGVILLIPHDNIPGMIGSIGSVLGDANINIFRMQVSKTNKFGENIMAIAVSCRPEKSVCEKIEKIAGVHGMRIIDCGELDD